MSSFSFWEKESFLQPCDVIVIGSGIVGLNTAIRLKERQPKWHIRVLERGILPEGASTRNAGFACFGSLTELQEDLEKSNDSEVFALVQRRFEGLQRLRQRVGDKALQYEEYGGYEIFKTNEKPIFEKCKDEIAYFNEQIAHITQKKDTYQLAPNHFGFQGILPDLVLNTSEGQIHTGEMMRNLLQIAKDKGIELINGVEVLHFIDDNGVTLHTQQGFSLKSQYLVVATNGFARQLLSHLAVTPARNQVLITEPIENLPFKGCFHYDRGYYYFRNVGNRLLLGGGRNLDFQTEQTDQFGDNTLIQNALDDLLKTTILPNTNFKIAYHWSGILGIGEVKKPIIERISPNVVVAVRMGGMGIAIGTLVGEEAADLILD